MNAASQKLSLRAGLILCTVGVVVVWLARVQASPETTAPAWTQPANVSLQLINPMPETLQGRLAYEDNLNCVHQSMKVAGSDQLVDGCFMSTAFGALDIENNMLNFAGDDNKAIPLRAYGSHDVLIPWPNTTNIIDAIPLPVSGVSLQLYRGIMPMLHDEHNWLGQVIAKQITGPANLQLRDDVGKPLEANFNTLAFSDNGSWLALEKTTGSFVRINLASLDAVAFAPIFANSGGTPGIEQSQLAVDDGGRYIAVVNTVMESFRVYDLHNCSADRCAFHEYWSNVAGINGLLKLTHIRFVNDGLLSLTAITKTGAYQYELAPRASIGPLLDYLALGDSYGSGEGAGAYSPLTDTANNRCHLSVNSYPFLLTHALYSSQAGRSVACSGARINDIISNSGQAYGGQLKDSLTLADRPAAALDQARADFTPGYLPQADFVSKYQPAILTVGISGNDIGFGDILKRCAVPHLNVHVNINNICYATYEERLTLAQTIDNQVPRLTKLYKALQQKSPATTIYAVGYPLIAVDDGACALNVHLTTNELALSIDIINHLNASIAEAARLSNVTYVDISQALAGHRLCETDSKFIAMNGLTAGRDGGISVHVGDISAELDFLASESYHPTAYGQQLIAEAIRRQTNNFTKHSAAPVPFTPAVKDSGKLLAAPKSGKPAASSASTSSFIPKTTAKKNTTLPVKISGAASGLKPSSSHTVTIGQGSGTKNLGTVTSSSDGTIDAQVPLPPDAPSGWQPIIITGPNQFGDMITIINIIYIVVADTDYDGDGLPNEADSCPTIPNSSVDADHDGTDDACDGFIGTLAVVPPTSNGGGTTAPTGGTSTTSNGTSGSPASPVVSPPASGPTTPPAGSPTTSSGGSNNNAPTTSPAVVTGPAATGLLTLPNVQPAQGDISSSNPVLIPQGLGLSGSLAAAGQVLGVTAPNNSSTTTLGQNKSGKTAAIVSPLAKTVNPQNTPLGTQLNKPILSRANSPLNFAKLLTVHWWPWALCLGLILAILVIIGRRVNREQAIRHWQTG